MARLNRKKMAGALLCLAARDRVGCRLGMGRIGRSGIDGQCLCPWRHHLAGAEGRRICDRPSRCRTTRPFGRATCCSASTTGTIAQDWPRPKPMSTPRGRASRTSWKRPDCSAPWCARRKRSAAPRWPTWAWPGRRAIGGGSSSRAALSAGRRWTKAMPAGSAPKQERRSRPRRSMPSGRRSRCSARNAKPLSPRWRRPKRRAISPASTWRTPWCARRSPASSAIARFASAGWSRRARRCSTSFRSRDLFVVANFKETQLETHPPRPDGAASGSTAIRTLALEGVVDSFAPGSGSAFSLIPADNATGNFVRVVQRVPVKIRLRQQSAARPPGPRPLRAGRDRTPAADRDRRGHPRREPRRARVRLAC